MAHAEAISLRKPSSILRPLPYLPATGEWELWSRVQPEDSRGEVGCRIVAAAARPPLLSFWVDLALRALGVILFTLNRHLAGRRQRDKELQTSRHRSDPDP